MYSVALEPTILPLSMVTPSLLLLWYFHSRDAYPEPASVIWKTFALGVLTVIPVLAFALPLSSYAEGFSSPYLAGLYDAFVLAALPEEAAKLAVVYWYARRHSEFDEPMDGLVYGVAASLGFATLENILYVADGGLGVALMRALTSIPGHATFGAIMGYFVGQAHFEPGRARRFLFLALALPVLLHGVYDAPLMIAPRADSADGQLVGLLLLLVPAALIVSIFTALRMSKKLRAEQLA
ncbi:MAG TPA: PrsW family intramembrane metalloprotease, partial [Nannocystis exedens]|nr:PrsW family intramembrane metalloprotease [Nannocystis exedens]